MHKADALEKLKRKYAEAGKTKEKLQAEIDALDTEAKQLQEDAERAASRQDLTAYTAAKEAARRGADKKEFLKLQIQQADTPAEEGEILTAWTAYADKASAKLREYMNTYTQARDALTPLFEQVMDQQEAILNERTQLAKLTGIEKKKLKCQLIEISEVRADRQFFARTGAIDRAEDMKHGAILYYKILNG